MKKQKENSYEGITWSEMGKQNVQAEKVYWGKIGVVEEVHKVKFAKVRTRILISLLLKAIIDPLFT